MDQHALHERIMYEEIVCARSGDAGGVGGAAVVVAGGAGDQSEAGGGGWSMVKGLLVELGMEIDVHFDAGSVARCIVASDRLLSKVSPREF